MTELRGPYQVKNLEFISGKAGQADDPRNIFYKNMLECRSYEAYLASVGRVRVEIPGYKAGPITGRMEILYARRNRWIADA